MKSRCAATARDAGIIIASKKRVKQQCVVDTIPADEPTHAVLLSEGARALCSTTACALAAAAAVAIAAAVVVAAAVAVVAAAVAVAAVAVIALAEL